MKELKKFWPFYMQEHRHPWNRRLHFIGTLGAIAFLAYAFLSGRYLYLWGAPLFGYGFAWIGHFFIEKNRPATFKHPFKSLICDFVMFFRMFVRKL